MVGDSKPLPGSSLRIVANETLMRLGLLKYMQDSILIMWRK